MELDGCPSPSSGLQRFCFFFALFCFLFEARSACLSRSHEDPTFNPPFLTLHNRFLAESNDMVMDSENNKCSEKINKGSQLREAFKMLDANFFDDTKVLDIAREAKELNLPIFAANRELVASENGGLHNPSCLIFNPEWTDEQVENASNRFGYPTLSGIQKPKTEEDIAFMSILELGELIRTKQITSLELVQIFLQRLKSNGRLLAQYQVQSCSGISDHLY